MKKGALAIRYAQALFDAAEEHQKTEEVYNEINAIATELETYTGFRQFIMDKSIGAANKRNFIESTLGDHLTLLTRNFLYIIFDKNREHMILEAVAAFNDLWQQKQGVLPAQIITAKPLAKTIEDQLLVSLKKAFDKDVSFDREVDSSLLGGAVIHIGDLTIDGSLKSRLSHMRKDLTR